MGVKSIWIQTIILHSIMKVKLKSEPLEKNLLRSLKEANLEKHAKDAKTFMLEISPLWNSLRSYEDLKVNEIDEELHTYLEENSIYMNT